MKAALIAFFSFFILSSQAQWKLSDMSPLPLAETDKLSFDDAFSSDSLGNTYYCWTDFRNGQGELYAQKLDKFGVEQWTKNGLRVGVVVAANNYTLNLKNIQPLSTGGAVIAWHKMANLGNTAQKEVYYNFISKDGSKVLNEGAKVETSRTIYNTNVTEGILTVNEIEKDLVRIVYNTGVVSGGSNGIYAIDINTQGEIINPEKFISSSPLDGSKAAFDNLDKRLILLIREKYELYLAASFDSELNSVVSDKAFLNDPFRGTSRIDEVFIQDGDVIIGRTLWGESERKVIVHRLNENLENVWTSGDVILGSATAFDIHSTLNADGGGTVAWIEPSSSTEKMMAARIDKDGNLLWKRPIFNAKAGLNYFMPNKFASDGKGGFYNLWFTTKSGGFNLSLQHMDGDGNQLWGSDGLQIESFNWYGVFRVLSHIDGGLISLYSGTTNGDINANDTYNLFTNYISPEGVFGIEQKLTTSLNKAAYCSGETISADLPEGVYAAQVQDGDSIYILEKGAIYNQFVLPVDLAENTYQIVISDENELSSDPLDFEIKALSAPNLSGDVLEKCSESDEALTLNGTCSLGSILWSTEDSTGQIFVSPASTSSFTAVCEKASCATSESSSLEVSIIEISATASSKNTYLTDESIALSATGGDSYVWTGPNGFTSSKQNPAILAATLANSGTYQVLVSRNGCTSSASVTLEVKAVLSIEKVSSLAKIYPNPAYDFLKYSSDLQVKSAAAVAMNGQQSKLYFDKQDRLIKVYELVPGSYILKLGYEDGTFSFARFIKK
ncbi:MAG: hypothetical protein ACI9IP_002112 [Arcticibacterium sp.]|jgi:hypothetical protein